MRYLSLIAIAALFAVPARAQDGATVYKHHRASCHVDTDRDYQTVNGQPARGGSLDGAGPVIAAGMLFVTSGYAQFGGAPLENVLLAFSVYGK